MQLLVRALFLVLLCFSLSDRVSSQSFQNVNMMFYIMADNNAGCSAIDSINQLASIAGSAPSARITIFWQRSTSVESCGDQTVLGQAPYTGVKVFQVTANSLTLTSDLGVVDAGSAPVLNSFITSTVTGFNAAVNYLTFLGPGQYFAFGSQNSQNMSGSFWLFKDLAAALNDTVRSLNLPSGKLDLVWFDSSFSASHENMQLFSWSANYFAGFQSIQPKGDYTVFGGLANIPVGVNFSREAIAQNGASYYNLLVQKNPNHPLLTFCFVDTSKIAAVTEAFDTLSRAFRLFPQHTFADVRRNVLEVDPSPFPLTQNVAVDLGYLSYWLTVYRRFPFQQKGWGPDLTNAINDAVLFSGRSDALAGATGISVFFPLTNSTNNYYITTQIYRFYDFNFAWYSFLLTYLFTPHEEYFFTTPRIAVNNDGSYDLIVNTTLDSVAQANLLYGIYIDTDPEDPYELLISGASRVQVANFSEANFLVGHWDGNVFRIPNTEFYPFVQRFKSANLISIAMLVNGFAVPLKGYFNADTLTVTNFYIQDGPNTVPYNLKAGTEIHIATTQPYNFADNDFSSAFGEIALNTPVFTVTSDNLITLENIRFTTITTQPNAYVFLTTRNVDDIFGFVGWRIPIMNPTSVYLLHDQNRLLTNVTVNFVQLVAGGKTKLKVTIRNYGFRDTSINYLTITGLPEGITNGFVRPAGACASTDATFTAIKCLVDFIPAKSFAKLQVVLPKVITTALSLSAAGDNFTPRNVTARIVTKVRATKTRIPSKSASPAATPL